MNKLEVQKRLLLGKKAKRVALENMTPAVIYNSKGDSTPVKVSSGEIERLLQTLTTSTVVTLTLEGKDLKVLVKEIDPHPITDVVRHVSFFEIDENQVMIFSVPVELKGKSLAVKNNLGVLIQPMKSLEVKCLLKDLTDVIEINISHLDVPGASVLLRDIELPEGMSLPNDEALDNAVVTISQLQKLVETEDAEAAEAELDEDGEPVEGEVGEEGAEGAEEAAEEK